MVWPWSVSADAALGQGPPAADEASPGTSSASSRETTSRALHSVAETANQDTPARQYKLVCDKRQDFIDNDPTVKFMLHKLEEVRSLPLKELHCASQVYELLITFCRQDANSQRIGLLSLNANQGTWADICGMD